MGETEDYGDGCVPLAHGTSHQDGGSDKIAVGELLGELHDEQKSAWTKVSGKPATFAPTVHATSHEAAGADVITAEGLAGELTAEQKSAWAKVSGKPTTFAPPFASSAEIIAGTEAAKATAPDQIAAAKAAGYFGKLVQIQHAVVTDVISGNVSFPIDNSIPQSNEGFEIITCKITPKNVANLLFIIAETIYGTFSTNACQLAMALFQDATAGALAAVTCGTHYAYGCKTLTHKMVAGTVAETTFKVRFGSDSANTITLNSVPATGGRVFGGVASTTLTIMEYST